MNHTVIYSKLLEQGLSNGERSYASVHQWRFESILVQLERILNPGLEVGSIGLSIIDPLINDFVNKHHSSYQVILPDEEFESRIDPRIYRSIERRYCDLTKSSLDTQGERAYDVILFYETLEHIFAADDTIISNVAGLLKSGGILLGSVPNAVRGGARFGVMFGHNFFWVKSSILHGAFGGYGHIREYTFEEISKLLKTKFVIQEISGENPYRTRGRAILNLMPKSWSQIIRFHANKK